MPTIFRTLSGSLYEVHPERSTWRRQPSGRGESQPFERGDSGAGLLARPLKIGEPAVLIGPPVAPSEYARMVITTAVLSIEEHN